MALYITSETEPQQNPVFLQVLEEIVGGVTIRSSSRIPSDLHTLFAGTALATCPTVGEYQFIKTAVLSTAHTAGQATTRIMVKQHAFNVGDFVYCGEKAGGTAASCTTITAIADTYIVTIVTTFGMTKGSVIYETKTDGATAPAFRTYAILRESVLVREDDGTTLYNVFAPAVVRGTVVESLSPYGYSADQKNRLTNFRFVSSKNK